MQPSPPHERSRDVGASPRPQYALRSLLLAVAATAALFSVMRMIGAFWSFVLVWALLLALGHVAGNSWSRWRRPRDDDYLLADTGNRAANRTFPVEFAQPTLLRETNGLGRAALASILLGVVLGAGLGMAGLIALRTHIHGLGPGGILIGAASTAVLGGLLGFVTGTFVGVFLRAWGQAAGDSASGDCAASNRIRHAGKIRCGCQSRLNSSNRHVR